MHEKFDLNQIAQGELGAKIALAWQEILENLQNPNTSFKSKRKLTITLTCEQNEQRDTISVEGQVKTSLAPTMPVVTRFASGQNLKTGESYAFEYGALDSKQISFKDIEADELTTTEDGFIIDSEGEVLGRKDEHGIIHFRKVK